MTLDGIRSFLSSKIKKKDKVIDVGCGIGLPLERLDGYDILGIDAYDYSDRYNFKFKKGILPEVLKEFGDNEFDCAICCDNIEHLEKDKGFKLLDELDRITKRFIYIFTPKIWDNNEKAVTTQKYWSYGNDYNYHRSLWKVEEFEERGYTIISNEVNVIAFKEKT